MELSFLLLTQLQKNSNLKISNTKYSIKEGCALLVDIMRDEDITISSKCLFLRPVIFNYNGDYFDVFHG